MPASCRDAWRTSTSGGIVAHGLLHFTSSGSGQEDGAAHPWRDAALGAVAAVAFALVLLLVVVRTV